MGHDCYGSVPSLISRREKNSTELLEMFVRVIFESIEGIRVPPI